MTTITDKATRSGAAKTAVPSDKGADATSRVKPKGKRGKRKKIIIAIVLLLVVGVAAKMFLLKGKPVDPDAPLRPGPLVALDAVTVNLSGGHYLRIGATVEFASTVSATAPPDGAQATDQIIVYFTGQDAAPLETAAGLAKARTGLKAKIAAAYPDDPVYDVLFTSFVVQ